MRAPGTPPPVRGRRTANLVKTLDNGNTPARAGKTSSGIWAWLGVGNTPARAGKTVPHEGGARRPKEHPRPCGEDYVCASVSVCVLGTPPPVRGRHRGTKGGGPCIGNTPARAGKTLPDQRLYHGHLQAVPDHYRHIGTVKVPDDKPRAASNQEPVPALGVRRDNR